MAKIIKTTGEEIEVQPENGEYFELEELQKVVDGFIEIVHIKHGLMVVNEEGHLIGLPVNNKASQLYPGIIVGDVLVCDSNQIQ